jgi:hypothetical protein
MPSRARSAHGGAIRTHDGKLKLLHEAPIGTADDP